ncbi:biopolymer transporter ExbD [Psychromonas sp. MB-3u-54]|uniref:ExbD/TolR family protein n=1 Tax=Psychromonas sp. MB-3u-54 TaxID=2058319 RepID=UPI000C33B9E0|nr:biopolymer transporter ExbD [Psychromonas sp. MB-3u-54]PKH04278.1 biopolymer transporter ExbD [Psychromonas sp. MB-3u-54]
MLLDLSPPKRKQAISLTPLIDVVFILLLFFMLSSSFAKWQAIQLPASTASQQASNELVRVILHRDGNEFSVNAKRYKVTNLNALTELIAKNPQTVFALQVEKQVSTQALITLLDNFKKSGARNVSFAGVIR